MTLQVRNVDPFRLRASLFIKFPFKNVFILPSPPIEKPYNYRRVKYTAVFDRFRLVDNL